jgi:hypothetical protein
MILFLISRFIYATHTKKYVLRVCGWVGGFYGLSPTAPRQVQEFSIWTSECLHMFCSGALLAMQSGAGSAVSWASLSFLMQPQTCHGPSPLAAQPSNALAQLILSGVEPLAPGHAQCRDGWMGRKCLSYRRGEGQVRGEGGRSRCDVA